MTAMTFGVIVSAVLYVILLIADETFENADYPD